MYPNAIILTLTLVSRLLVSSVQATPFLLPRIGNPNPVLTASFTWNDKCGRKVACGPSSAGVKGIGTTAANNLTFASGQSLVNGHGAGCGQCWHLQPQKNPFPTNGKGFGTPVIARINDQCTDGGYCDQTESRPLNKGYGRQVHFDLCGETGTAAQFFGEGGRGVLVGIAQLELDCQRLTHHGPQGSEAGPVRGHPGKQTFPGGGNVPSFVAGVGDAEVATTSSSVPAPTQTQTLGIVPVGGGRSIGNLSSTLYKSGGLGGVNRFNTSQGGDEGEDDDDDDDDDECEGEAF